MTNFEKNITDDDMILALMHYGSLIVAAQVLECPVSLLEERVKDEDFMHEFDLRLDKEMSNERTLLQRSVAFHYLQSVINDKTLTTEQRTKAAEIILQHTQASY